MIFEIINQNGNPVMTTNYEECIYDSDTLTEMQRAGYKFKLNGKIVPKKEILNLNNKQETPPLKDNKISKKEVKIVDLF